MAINTHLALGYLDPILKGMIPGSQYSRSSKFADLGIVKQEMTLFATHINRTILPQIYPSGVPGNISALKGHMKGLVRVSDLITYLVNLVNQIDRYTRANARRNQPQENGETDE